MLLQREKGVSNKTDTNVSFNPDAAGSDKDKDGLNPSVITEAVSQQDQTRNDLDAFDNFSTGTTVKIPTPARNVSHMTPADRVAYYKSVEDAKKKGKVTNSNDPKEMETRFKNNFTPEQQTKYMETYNALSAQGKIPKGTNPYVKTSQDAIQKDWKRRATVEYSNQIIDVTAMDNDILASPNLISKPAGEKNTFIQKRIANAIGNKQNLVFDPETGKPVDMQGVDLTKVDLIGHYSPMNKLPKIGGNEDNSVSPYKISWTDEDGEIKTAFMMRDASELSKPVFKGAKVIKKTTDKAVDNEGNYTSFNQKTLPELSNADLSPLGLPGRGMNGMRVKYDVKSNTYSLEIIDKNNKSHKMTNIDSATYQNIMYDMIE